MKLLFTREDGIVEERDVNCQFLLDTAAIDTAEMPLCSGHIWLDQALNTLRVKVKYPDGTVKTGTIATLV